MNEIDFITKAGWALVALVYMRWVIQQAENGRNKVVRYVALSSLILINLFVCSACLVGVHYMVREFVR